MARILLVQLGAFAGVFAVLGLATLLSARLKLQTETSRKLVHILLSHWIILTALLCDTAWEASIAPACFIVINFISYKKGTFAAIERREDNSPGTVWFAVSLFLLSVVFFSLGKPYVAVCGMLAMGYGDGFAALVGMRWGRRHFPEPFQDKSTAGSLTVFVLVVLPVAVVCLVAGSPLWWMCALAAGGFGCVLELLSPRGLDNLTLPLGVAAVVWFCGERPGWWGPLLLGASLTLMVLVAAYALRAITLSGAGGALALGVLLGFWGSWWALAALVAFFVLGSGVSRVGRERKQSAARLHKRQGTRGIAQVAANGLPCLLFALVHSLSRGAPGLLAAVYGCLAAACADTFSSELGMLSRGQPVSILTLRPVEKGTSGGVSALGLCGAGLGALCVALISVWDCGLRGAGVVLLAGVFGSLADSLLGALTQVKYHKPEGGLTEQPEMDGVILQVASGWRWMDNDLVNLLSGLAAGALCALLGAVGALG